MKIITVNITAPQLPGLANVTLVKSLEPEGKFAGWQVSIRGPLLFLVSPPGWAEGNRVGLPLHERKGKQRRAFAIPLTSCVVQWEIDDVAELDKCQKHDGEVFQRLEAA